MINQEIPEFKDVNIEKTADHKIHVTVDDGQSKTEWKKTEREAKEGEKPSDSKAESKPDSSPEPSKAVETETKSSPSNANDAETIGNQVSDKVNSGKMDETYNYNHYKKDMIVNATDKHLDNVATTAKLKQKANELAGIVSEEQLPIPTTPVEKAITKMAMCDELNLIYATIQNREYRERRGFAENPFKKHSSEIPGIDQDKSNLIQYTNIGKNPVANGANVQTGLGSLPDPQDMNSATEVNAPSISTGESTNTIGSPEKTANESDYENIPPMAGDQIIEPSIPTPNQEGKAEVQEFPTDQQMALGDDLPQLSSVSIPKDGAISKQIKTMNDEEDQKVQSLNEGTESITSMPDYGDDTLLTKVHGSE